MSKFVRYSLLCSLFLIAACQIAQLNTPSQENTQIVVDTARPLTSATNVTVTPIIPPDSIDQKTVQLAWFYKPPENSPLVTLAENFDFFILTHRDEEERDELRTLGVNTTIYQYLLFVQIMDPGSCTERPYGNQVAYEIGDFCRLEKEHPDWFLRDKNGDIIRKGLNAYMDAGNSEYRQFWLERAQQMQVRFGWNGIFIDNVEASLDKLDRLGALPAKYETDAEYQAAIEGFLQYLYNNYFQPQNIPVMANIIELKDDLVWYKYLQYLDGAMIESFAVDYNNHPLLPTEWKRQINLAIQSQAEGKSLILVAQGEQDDSSREEFALASYLLVNDGKAFFRYTNSNSYELLWLYDNYSLSLGNPLGPAKSSGLEWHRSFENGTVKVNPFTGSAQIFLKPY